MSNFFPISRGDVAFIVILLVFAVVSFLPWSRESAWAGMDMLGWMMAILMVLSPVIALIRLRQERTGTGDDEGGDV
jgi:hypothetical protein